MKVNVGVLVVGGVVTGLLVALLAAGFGNDPRAVPDALVNQPAPGFVLQDLDGKEWSLAAAQGRPVVINFWSTWCLPCKQEYAALQRAAERHKDVQFFGIVFSDEVPKVTAQLARETISPTYPNLVDPGSRVAIDWGVAGVPETYFVDASGLVVYKHKGPLSEGMLDRMLGGEP